MAEDSPELLECSVCLSLLQDPCTLPCGHTFCLPCIRATLVASPHRRCPLCNATVPYGHQLRVSILVRQLVEALLEKQQQQKEQAATAMLTGGAVGSPLETHTPPPLLQQQQQERLPQALHVEGSSPNLAEQRQEQQQPQRGSEARPSPRPPPLARPPTPPQPLLQAALHSVEEATAVAAQLVLYVLLSPAAGAPREAAWLALAVVLPPMLAVWGCAAVWTLLLATGALLLAARRQWRPLVLLLAAAAAADVAAGLGWWQTRNKPLPAPW